MCVLLPIGLRVVFTTFDQSGVVYCPDAVFIMTSNVAADQIKESSPFLRALIDKTEHRPEEYSRHIGQFNRTIYPFLKKAFRRDEFIGRINQIIVFLPLNDEEVGRRINPEGNWATDDVSFHRYTLLSMAS